MPKTRRPLALLTNDDALRARLTEHLPQFDLTAQPDAALAVLVDAQPGALPMADLGGTPVIALLDTVDFAAARRLFLTGAADVLPRSAQPTEIAAAVAQLLKRRANPLTDPPELAPELFYLREVSQAASAGAELPWLLDRVVGIVADLLGVDRVSLMLLDDDQPTANAELTIRAARGLAADIIAATRVPLGDGISGRVAASGQALLVTDVEHASLGIDANRPDYSTKGLLSVPIKARRRTIGVLNVNNKRDGAAFDEADLALLSTLCAQAGLAIDNASLLDQLRRHAAELASLNKRLADINRAKSELIVNLSHEIKTPLTAIQGYVDLMQSGFVEPGKVPDMLDKVRNRSRHLSRLTERMITFFTLDSGLAKQYRQPFGFDVLTWKCVEEVRDHVETKNLTVRVDAPSLRQRVLADEQQYRELLLALLDNAVKFNRPGGEIHVGGKTVADGDRTVLEVTITDTGAGIAENIQAVIFEDFRQTDDVMTAKPDGLGLGLAIAKAIADGHGCRLRLVRSDPQGSAFAFTAPLAGDEDDLSPPPKA